MKKTKKKRIKTQVDFGCELCTPGKDGSFGFQTNTGKKFLDHLIKKHDLPPTERGNVTMRMIMHMSSESAHTTTYELKHGERIVGVRCAIVPTSSHY